MKGYKGFDKDLKCLNKQYKIGRKEIEESTLLCYHGLHFCENPHDIFKYYAAGCGNRFCEVEAAEVSDEKKEDSKRVAKHLFVKKEISVFHICKIAVSTFFENFGFKSKIDSVDLNCGAVNAGDYGAANAGYYSASNAGDYGASNVGYNGAANAGFKGAANAGNCGAANVGDYGAANVGNYGAANAGYKGAANAGNYGLANAGYYGTANAGVCGTANANYKGSASVKENGVAISSTGGKIKGGKGAVLVLINRDKNYKVIDSAMAVVDDITIKSDTWYKLENGKLVPCE